MKVSVIIFWNLLLLGPLMGFAQSSFLPLQDEGIYHDAQAVGTWLNQNPNFQELAWTLSYERVSPGGKHYTFIPSLKGIPILGGMVKINVDTGGKLRSLVSDFPSSIRVISTDFSHAPLRENSLNSITQGGVWNKRFELKGGELFPIWHREFSPDSNRTSLISSQVRASLPDTVGWGQVFLPDPCTKGQVRYGELFEDNEDRHSPEFDALMDSVKLLDILFEDGLFKLKGPYVEIFDITDRNIPPATSEDGNFFFTRDQSGFEDVMAYYHIDRFQRYVQELGFTNLQNRPIRVDTHGFIGDQSEFVRLGDASYLKFGEGGVDDAEDADVIIHEYAHALSYAANRPERYSCERLGLDEGIADYFAAGYSWDISPYDWENLFNWDGNNPFFPGRSVAITTMYPLEDCSLQSGENDINDWGQIWASAMMKLRIEIGGVEADRIMLQALYGLTEESNFSDAAQLVLEADELLYQGAHSERINFHFCVQGIVEGSSCLSVSQQGEIFDRSASDFYIQTLPGSSRMVFHWKGNPSQRGMLSFQLFTLLGQKIVDISGPKSHKWEEKIPLSAGLYVFKLKDSLGTLIDVGKVWMEK